MGRRNNPLFRVVVTEGSRGPKSEKAVEILGSYDPHQNVKTIDAERAFYWISKGVQPSGTVHNLLVDLGVVKTKKVNVLPQKSPVKKDEPEEAKPVASGEEATAPETEGESPKAETGSNSNEEANTPAETAPDAPAEEKAEQAPQGESDDQKSAEEKPATEGDTAPEEPTA